MRIPFDSLTLAAVVAEIKPLEGARLERVVQPDAHTLLLQIYDGRENWVLISCHPNYSRAHLISKRPEKPPEVLPLATEMRRWLDSATVKKIRQQGLDRILEIQLESDSGRFALLAELMGKNSNIMLVSSDGRVLAAARWVGSAKSKRPILPGKPYSSPPTAPKPSLLQARFGEDLKQYEGSSRIVEALVKAEGDVGLKRLQKLAGSRAFHPVFVPGYGAYPTSVASLGFKEVARPSIGYALEQHYDSLIEQDRQEQLRTSLLSQLRRVELAREVALNELEQSADAARRAAEIQMKGELILAYQHQIQPADRSLKVMDYSGKEIEIPLLPDLKPIENAQRLFDKAKRAKSNETLIKDQIARISADLHDVRILIDNAELADTYGQMQDLREEADRRRWLHHQPSPTLTKEEKPFQGKRVKELVGPKGYKVFVGENSEANDYITVRFAKPNDIWLHVRGATSAHVVIQTQNQPDKVPREVLEYAARIAVQHSALKHSAYVPVDYTLKKYVRRPKGAAPGLAVYEREKTIHVENAKS